MWKAFTSDTALSENQVNLVRSRYNQLKDHSLHLSLVVQAIPLIEKGENRSLFILFEQGFKEMGPLYPLVLIASIYPSIVTLYDRLDIDSSIREATLSDIGLWVTTYEEQHHGHTGLDRYGWICRHLCAKVLRLGRLQFEPRPFRFPFTIYYDTELLTYRMFAQEDLICDADGYIGSVSDSWTTTCSIADGFLFAHEVDQKRGSISCQAISLPLSKLKPVATENTPCIAVHIPKGGSLTPSLVDASFAMAQAMFSPRLFVCDSWLLDPELLHVLPPESNIINFMQRFNKFPVSFTLAQIYERVFGFGALQQDVLTWQCTTTLQKRVQQHIKEGGIFRTTGGYIPSPYAP